MKKYIITIMMTSLLFGQVYFFGVNDWLALLFVFITAIFLYQTLIKLQAGNRKLLSVNSEPGSWAYRYLTRETTFWMRVVVTCISLITSSVLIMVLKGIVIQQGYVPFFIVIIVSSLILYGFINKRISHDIIEANINHQITQYGSQLASILYSAIILNIILSLTFSAHDTFAFMTSEVTFSNFIQKASEQAIERNQDNNYSRVFLNMYLIVDQVKLAIANIFVDMFEQKGNFYLFFIVILFLNMVKMLAFSISIVTLQRGFDEIATASVPVIKKGTFVFSERLTSLWKWNRLLSATKIKIWQYIPQLLKK